MNTDKVVRFDRVKLVYWNNLSNILIGKHKKRNNFALCHLCIGEGGGCLVLGGGNIKVLPGNDQ